MGDAKVRGGCCLRRAMASPIGLAAKRWLTQHLTCSTSERRTLDYSQIITNFFHDEISKSRNHHLTIEILRFFDARG